jgi:hypothetical protein
MGKETASVEFLLGFTQYLLAIAGIIQSVRIETP